MQRRLAELRRRGVLYVDVDFDLKAFDRRKQVMLWLAVSPAALMEAGIALAQHPETSFVASTTGTSGLCAAVACTDARALHRYLAEPLAAIAEIIRVETAPIVRTLKRAGYAAHPPSR